MNVRTMRIVDRFAGIPLCRMLGFFISKKHDNSIAPKPESVKNILVIKFFGLGSILLSTPALQLLRSTYPSARLTFLTFGRNREILERISSVDSILTIESSSFSEFFLTTYRTLHSLRKAKFDLVFDFEFFSKFSTLLSGITGAPYRVGFDLPVQWRKKIVTHSVPLTKEKHVTQAFVDQVFTLSKPVPIPDLQHPLVHQNDVTSLKNKLTLNGQGIIVINVNAGETFLERRWQPDHYAALLKRLQNVYPDFSYYFTGLQHERPYIQSIIDATASKSNCYNTAGELLLGELIALFKQSLVVISNDSAPLHIAAALRVPSIGLYGPESPKFYGPVGTQTITIYKSISCSPCMNIYDAKSFTCPYNAKCMQEISVEEVFQAVEQQLNRNR